MAVLKEKIVILWRLACPSWLIPMFQNPFRRMVIKQNLWTYLWPYFATHHTQFLFNQYNIPSSMPCTISTVHSASLNSTNVNHLLIQSISSPNHPSPVTTTTTNSNPMVTWSKVGIFKPKAWLTTAQRPAPVRKQNHKTIRKLCKILIHNKSYWMNTMQCYAITHGSWLNMHHLSKLELSLYLAR